MTEQLYRVCWRAYLDDGRTVAGEMNPAKPIKHATDYVAAMKRVDSFLSTRTDYWIEAA